MSSRTAQRKHRPRIEYLRREEREIRTLKRMEFEEKPREWESNVVKRERDKNGGGEKG